MSSEGAEEYSPGFDRVKDWESKYQRLGGISQGQSFATGFVQALFKVRKQFAFYSALIREALAELNHASEVNIVEKVSPHPYCQNCLLESSHLTAVYRLGRCKFPRSWERCSRSCKYSFCDCWSTSHLIERFRSIGKSLFATIECAFVPTLTKSWIIGSIFTTALMVSW